MIYIILPTCCLQNCHSLLTFITLFLLVKYFDSSQNIFIHKFVILWSGNSLRNKIYYGFIINAKNNLHLKTFNCTIKIINMRLARCDLCCYNKSPKYIYIIWTPAIGFRDLPAHETQFSPHSIASNCDV